MRQAPKLALAISVAIAVSSCGARAVEPAENDFTPNSSVTIGVTTPEPMTSPTTAAEAPAIAESEVDQIEADLAEIEQLVTELDEHIDEVVTP